MVNLQHCAIRREDIRIAAIIPLYNGGPYIQQALESVLAQSLPPSEIIVVDDGSTDDGPQIVEQLAQQHPITLLRKPNGGQGSARNLGVAKSAGNLIAFLDQDDVWYPSHLAELVRPFLRDRTLELGWAYSNLDEIDERGRMVVRAALDSVPVQHPKRDLFGCLRTDMFILPSSSLITRKAFDAVGGFDERLRGFEDDDLFLRMFRLGYDNVYTRKALSQWRVFGSSSSYSPSMAVSRMVYVRKLFEEFPDEPVRTRFWIRDILLPRFFPWMVREFTAAIQSGNQELIQTSYANLEFMARYHRRNVRLVIQLLGPVIRRPKATRLLAAVRPALQPLTRRVFR